MSNTARAFLSVPRPASGDQRLKSEEALARIRRFLEDWRMRADDNPARFVDFEKELHAKIMEFEREVIAEQTAHADIDVGAILVDGTTYRRVVRCQETYVTAAGPVQVLRTLYKDRSEEGERAISPMELRRGVVEGRWTPLAAQQAVWVVAQLTPLRAEELFARIGNMTPSKSSLDRLPKAMSARWEQERVEFEKALRDGDVILSEVTAALTERPELRLVKIADGALDNWTFLANEVPGGVEILDFYHAVEHLDDALGSVYGKGMIEARKRFAALRFELQEEVDGAKKVIRALNYLRKKHPKNARVTKDLAYFRNNRHRMRYQEFAAAGLPIGSGVDEAACKTLVTQRMKQSGMRWDEAGGQEILTVRGWTQSGDRFDRAWALLAATYQAEVVVLHNVVPFPPGRRQKDR